MVRRPKSAEFFLVSPWRVFLYAVRPWNQHLVLMLILVIIGNVFSYALPYFFKIIADLMTGAGAVHSFSDFLMPLSILASLYVGQEVFFRIGHMIESFIVVRMFERITTALYENILERPTAYFEEQFSGELSRRIEQIGEGVKYFIEYFPWEIAWPIIASAMGIVLLMTVDSLLVIVFLVWLALFLILSFFLLRWQYVKSQQLAQEHAALSGVLVDSLSNMSLVHAFAAQPYETYYYQRFMNMVIGVEKVERKLAVINKFHQGLSIAVLGMAFLIASIYLYLRGEMTVGDFVIVTSILTTFNGVVWTLGDTLLRSIHIYGGFKNAIESLQSEVVIVEDGDRELVLYQSPVINLEDVSFSYPNSQEKVLENLSLRINAGERVGLVGKSGIGKSTIVKLILRNYDPTKGEVTIDGENISSFTLNSLRQSISFVPQDTSLFHRSLYENILYAKPIASREEVIEASKRAYAHDFINQYPQQYETKVGERGVKLSGGQRQRIALARAVLKNAPILVLDEATSALDTESEEIVQKGLQELFEGRTVLAIAHRLSTLRSMDRIIVLDDEGVAEDGSPQELLAKEKSIFKDMWAHQKSGFI